MDEESTSPGRPYERLLEIESGMMSQGELTMLIALLIQTGEIWKLPTRYLDAAASLFENGILRSDPEWDKKVN
jgi:hypothetical protein